MVKTFDCKNTGENQTSADMDINSQILQELKSLGARMNDMEAKVNKLDVAPSPAKTRASSKDSDVSDEELILPTLDTLKKSRSIQEQVDARVKELQSIPEKGKLKSQRGGVETVFVKNQVLWP